MRQRGNWSVFPSGGEPPRAVVALAGEVEEHGGSVLAIYSEPVGERWQLFSLLPLEQVEPTPYQRDLSKPHAKRLTLGLLYERHPRFAGGAFSPILRRVDRFLRSGLTKAYEERERRAEEVEAADKVLSDLVARIKKRGITHPYIKNFVLARCNPLTRARKSVPGFQETFEKLRQALERFDVDRVRVEDIARAALIPAG